MTIFTAAGTTHFGHLACPCLPRYERLGDYWRLFHHLYSRVGIEP